VDGITSRRTIVHVVRYARHLAIIVVIITLM
jgi:hypothetical protein